jgi:hypothetical protein
MVERVRAELAIPTDGDVLRRERLTRSLYTELRTVEGIIDVRFAPETRPEEGGRKALARLATPPCGCSWRRVPRAAPACSWRRFRRGRSGKGTGSFG